MSRMNRNKQGKQYSTTHIELPFHALTDPQQKDWKVTIQNKPKQTSSAIHPQFLLKEVHVKPVSIQTSDYLNRPKLPVNKERPKGKDYR